MPIEFIALIFLINKSAINEDMVVMLFGDCD